MYYSNRDVRVEEMQRPGIGPGELLVKVIASGICGSDVLEWYRINRVPLVLGHEISGEIADSGYGVKGFKAGDRVCAAHHVPCGRCHYCINGHHTVCDTLFKTNFDPGGFSEYVRLPSINVERGTFIIPPDVGFEEATFVEPLACVWRAHRFSGNPAGRTVMVMGCGVAGLLHIQVARLLGAGRIIATDINEFRLEKARQFGADIALSGNEDIPGLLRSVNDGYLADMIILCTGATQAVNQAIKSIDRGGTILFFAVTDRDCVIPLHFNEIFWRTEVTFTSSYAGSQEDYARAMELIHLKKICVGGMITHRFGLDEIGDAFRVVSEAKDSLKVIIKPH
ncbi:alcohol dehydrogenase catalytic domain-containing protein [bacterium]|nr:alcohol dehydrogenase catalytic domain-containing protein [bacterium]